MYAEMAAEREARSEQRRMTRAELAIADAAADARAAAKAEATRKAAAVEKLDTFSAAWALTTNDMHTMGSALVCANIVARLTAAASASAEIAANSPPEVNVVCSIPDGVQEPSFVAQETGLVVRGICMFCKKEVTTTKLSMRGKDIITKQYFHVACNPNKPVAVQKAVDLFNKLKAASAVPGEVSASQQACQLFKKLSAAAVADAAAGETSGASVRGPVPMVPLFNGAAGMP